jgi:hypothetical protein
MAVSDTQSAVGALVIRLKPAMPIQKLIEILSFAEETTPGLKLHSVDSERLLLTTPEADALDAQKDATKTGT